MRIGKTPNELDREESSSSSELFPDFAPFICSKKDQSEFSGRGTDRQILPRRRNPFALLFLELLSTFLSLRKSWQTFLTVLSIFTSTAINNTKTIRSERQRRGNDGQEKKKEKKKTNVETDEIPHEDHAFLSEGSFDHCTFFICVHIAVDHVFVFEAFH